MPGRSDGPFGGQSGSSWKQVALLAPVSNSSPPQQFDNLRGFPIPIRHSREWFPLTTGGPEIKEIISHTLDPLRKAFNAGAALTSIGEFLSRLISFLRILIGDEFSMDAFRKWVQCWKENTVVLDQDVLKIWADLHFVLGFSRVFYTDSGRLGVSCPWIEARDILCLLSGGHCPYVLRPDIQPVEYRLIGHAVVDGLMAGEKWPDSTDDLQEFEIV